MLNRNLKEVMGVWFVSKFFSYVSYFCFLMEGGLVCIVLRNFFVVDITEGKVLCRILKIEFRRSGAIGVFVVLGIVDKYYKC